MRKFAEDFYNSIFYEQVDIDSLFETDNDIDHPATEEEAEAGLDEMLGGDDSGDSNDVYYFDPVTGEGKTGTPEEAAAAEEEWNRMQEEAEQRAQEAAEEMESTLVENDKGQRVTPEQDLANKSLDYGKIHDETAEQQKMAMDQLTNDKNLRDALFSAGDPTKPDSMTGRSAIELAHMAILGGDDLAATQFMALYGYDPTGVHSPQEAKYIQEAYQRNPTKQTMEGLTKQYSEVYNMRNQLLKEVGIQTAMMFGPSILGAISKAGTVALAGAQISRAGTITGGVAKSSKIAQELSKLGNIFAQATTKGGKIANNARNNIQALLNAQDKLTGVIDLIGKGLSAEQALTAGLMGDKTVKELGMMSEEQREQMLKDLGISVPPAAKTGGGTYQQYANAKPGDVINGHVVNQGDINYAIDMLNTGGTGKTGQGLNAGTLQPNGQWSNSNNQVNFGITWNQPVGTGVPVTPNDRIINDYGDVIVVANKSGEYTPAGDRDYDAKAGLQNQLAGYGVGYSKSSDKSEPQSATTDKDKNEINQDNPGEGDESDSSVDDTPWDNGGNSSNPNNPSSGGNGDSGGNNNNNPRTPPENSEEIKDKNDEVIDWNVNKNRIGLSKDPNRADYDLDKWNRGMEIQSTDMVSDERVKSYLTLSYNRDPVFTKLARVLRTQGVNKND